MKTSRLINCNHNFIEAATTSCGSSEEDIELATVPSKIDYSKHKTELCRTFSELGYCNYKNKCQFAHGKEELVENTQLK